ncbi:MAG TPA: thiamine phosphate synthase [Burkholderiales bacterium]
MAEKVSGVYAVTPDLADTELLLFKVEAVVRGGVRIVQYRNKTASPLLQLAQLERLLAVCRRAGASLIVNDDAQMAKRLGADGVHLGREDGDAAAARRVLGPRKWIGVSCYNELQRARDAAEAGADYVAFGSFFASSTKPGAVHARPELLREAKELGLPIVAIGGINAGNAGLLIEAGADAVAVVSALFDAADPEGEARRLCGLFSRTTDHGTYR